MKIKLKKPLTRDGKAVEELELRLEDLTGADVLSAEQEARMRGDASPNPLFSSQGRAILAARAAGIIVDDIIALSAPDFMLVTTEVGNFLFGWGYLVLPQSNSEE